MDYLKNIGERAKGAATLLNIKTDEEKNKALQAVAAALARDCEQIISANEKDVKNATEAGMKPSLLDRLSVNKDRILAMSEGLLQISELKSPLGEVLFRDVRPNGLLIEQKRVPIGVIGIIYESRPNVTADAFGLCFKTGNAVILRGGSDAIETNKAISESIRAALRESDMPEDAIILIEDTSRETARELMRLNGYIDVLIPRGGAGLIKTVVETSTLPVIETGTGNCHVYIDKEADIPSAVKIVENAKTQRLGVCNACESLVIHSDVLEEAVRALVPVLSSHGVVIKGDERARKFSSEIIAACDEDWGTEYLDAIISVKTVDSLDEAIAHINRYSTKHSESIITKNKASAERFLSEIDSAAVYHNASTRFTDGFEFGFGAEIGISTQKLHARGPMGLAALTSAKFVIHGDGQIR